MILMSHKINSLKSQIFFTDVRTVFHIELLDLSYTSEPIQWQFSSALLLRVLQASKIREYRVFSVW